MYLFMYLLKAFCRHWSVFRLHGQASSGNSKIPLRALLSVWVYVSATIVRKASYECKSVTVWCCGKTCCWLRRTWINHDVRYCGRLGRAAWLRWSNNNPVRNLSSQSICLSGLKPMTRTVNQHHQWSHMWGVLRPGGCCELFVMLLGLLPCAVPDRRGCLGGWFLTVDVLGRRTLSLKVHLKLMSAARGAVKII